jgi:hypothetical protein
LSRLIQSKLFTFYIGKDREEFVVHSKAIAAISPYFHALVNNDMTESQQASVEYEDIEPGDFTRFVEYAYRHDYTIPSWTREESATEAEATDSVPGSPSSNVSFREIAIDTSPSVPFGLLQASPINISVECRSLRVKHWNLGCETGTTFSATTQKLRYARTGNKTALSRISGCWSWSTLLLNYRRSRTTKILWTCWKKAGSLWSISGGLQLEKLV